MRQTPKLDSLLCPLKLLFHTATDIQSNIINNYYDINK